MEMMKAVSFMYVRPPGYNPESAKAAEIADEAQKQGQGHGGTSQDTSAAGVSTSGRPEVPPVQEKKKPRPKDVFGRLLPTEEEFEVLKNAPRYVLFSFRIDIQVTELY
ncbi:putative zinc finger cchc domain-containing protein [Nicotiana attenuata]|uniref:Zinc finger cchc domain-containing protein n=1 Tax=Nicotiana attenuata TaxID=49451 RepID=A0A314LAN4_NICAT|nr:putative zinc finger cchc domain-containing protein [Nicotiana attenuata]